MLAQAKFTPISPQPSINPAGLVIIIIIIIVASYICLRFPHLYRVNV